MKTPLDANLAEKITKDSLQPLLADLLSLSMNGKQAHWHVTGPNFRSVHLQLDEIIADARLWADTIAERAATLGQPISGQPRAIASGTALEDTPDGFMDAEKAVEIVSTQLKTTIDRARQTLEQVGEQDPVSQDLIIATLTALEKHLWMMSAQQS